MVVTNVRAKRCAIDVLKYINGFDGGISERIYAENSFGGCCRNKDMVILYDEPFHFTKFPEMGPNDIAVGTPNNYEDVV